MSKFLPQNMLSKKIASPLLVACFALTIVGCSRTEQTGKDSGAASSTEQKQLDTSTVACNNEQATSAINSYLVKRIQQQANKQSELIQQQASTSVDMSILQSSLSQVAISLENVNGTNGQCHATVSFNLPQAQLDNADKIYSRLRMPVVAEQIVSRGYQLQNSTLVANKVGFGLSANGGSYQVNSTTGDDVIGMVGEIIANSALAQTLTGPSNMPTSGAAPAVVIPSTSQTNVTNTTQAPRQPTTTVKKPVTVKPKPKTDSEKTVTKTTKTATKNTTTEETRKITPVQKDKKSEDAVKKPVKKEESSTSNADSKSSSTTEKATKPVTHEKVPTESNVKLKIEEKNEQY